MKYLFLSPHPDDIELTAGATIHRLIREGNTVTVAVFSDCDTDNIRDHVAGAHKALGVTDTLHFDYPQREFPKDRQSILCDILALRDEIGPDVVFLPDWECDIHQDHQVIGEEGLRAFKMTADIIAYSHAHNQVISKNNYFIAVRQEDVSAKLKSVGYYVSEAQRYYFKAESIIGIMNYYGVQCENKYAEAFRMVRVVDRLGKIFT